MSKGSHEVTKKRDSAALRMERAELLQEAMNTLRAEIMLA